MTITSINAEAMVSFKCFQFSEPVKIGVKVHSEIQGDCILFTNEAGIQEIGRISIAPSKDWYVFETRAHVAGQQALYLHYTGLGTDLAKCWKSDSHDVSNTT